LCEKYLFSTFSLLGFALAFGFVSVILTSNRL
jgi:hypothetical protein